VFPLFFLGFAIRGPLGLVEVCGVTCTYWALSVTATREQAIARFKPVIGYGVVGLVLLASGWLLLMKLAHIAGGESFAQDVRNMQVGGRLDESGKPFFFYFQLSLYRYFPVVPLALATLIALRQRWNLRAQDAEVQMTIRLGACGLMILLGLSVPHFKRAYYVLPMVPMFAAVAAYGLLNAQGWLNRVAKAYLWLVAVLPALGIVIVFVCHHLWHKHGYWPQVSLFLLVGVLVLLQMAALWAWCSSAQRTRRLLLLSLIALAAQWWLLVKMVEPEQDRQFDTQTFVSQVEALRAENPGTLVFVNLGRDTWAIRYMMNLTHDELPEPLFIGQSDLSKLASLPHPAWVIVARSERDLLDGTPLQGMEPAYSGRLNGNALLVFKAR
jgi:4-amino-4-deoxy-L-arabinose transferase-like glycosyltransferase